jgi:hypothetical protein
MGNETERVVEGLQGLLLEIDIAEIVVHKADQPNAIVDLLDAKGLASEDNRDVDFLAVQAEASAGVARMSRSWKG